MNKSSGSRGEKWDSRAVTGCLGICAQGTVGAGDDHWTPANVSIPLGNSIVLPWNGEEVIVTYFGKLLVRIQLSSTFKTLIILPRYAKHSIYFNHYYYVIVIIKLINLILVIDLPPPLLHIFYFPPIFDFLVLYTPFFFLNNKFESWIVRNYSQEEDLQRPI